MEEEILLLNLEMLSENPVELSTLEIVKTLLNKEIGWCYPLDITWIIKKVRKNVKPGGLILDAGAGGGILQFILAELGYNVISVDFSNRVFTKKILERYSKNLYFINSQESEIHNKYTEHLTNVSNINQNKYNRLEFIECTRNVKLTTQIKYDNFSFISLVSHKNVENIDVIQALENPVADCPGKIFFYKADFRDLLELPDSSIDCIVSCSAVEHSSDSDATMSAMSEFKRISKNEAPFFITTSASLKVDQTYYHAPSQGYCYSKKDLISIFGFQKNIKNNFDKFETIHQKLQCKENNYLYDNLASFYFKSDKNGMPLGKWDVQYLPVGIVKICNKGTIHENPYEFDKNYCNTIHYIRNCDIQNERRTYLSLINKINEMQADILLLAKKRKSLINDKINLQKKVKLLSSKI